MDPMKAALAWSARMGWPVFPTRNKVPLVPAGVSWKEFASKDPERIRAMSWDGADGYGIALPPDWVVVDLDAEPDSPEPLAKAWQTLKTKLPDVAELVANGEVFSVKTKSGGRHLYFRHDGSLDLRQTSFRPNVDLRVGGKGYVIGPDSEGYSVDVWSYSDVRHKAPIFVGTAQNLVPFLTASRG